MPAELLLLLARVPRGAAAVEDLPAGADGHRRRPPARTAVRGRRSLFLRGLFRGEQLRVAVPAVDVAVARRVGAHALEPIAIVNLPNVGLAVRAVGVAANSREAAVHVVLPHVGPTGGERRVDVFFLDAPLGEVDPRIYLAVEVRVRLFVERLALLIEGADHVLQTVEVGVDLAAQRDGVAAVPVPHRLEDPADVRAQRAGPDGLTYLELGVRLPVIEPLAQRVIVRRPVARVVGPARRRILGRRRRRLAPARDGERRQQGAEDNWTARTPGSREPRSSVISPLASPAS